ncbi:hypothetical protein PF010_g8066 [Phytophthora fragariae]|uniref:Uncharacterized protein n=1 Tax=Phytophthora fragariae TaxID=53985 RepID=A0A6A3F5I6_9STRA|nr:hypothetical protein PF009_g9602 [Phytophthora fragariae]KAE9118873.1 hypothetical protein PF010_g8066 [Phytophthora fragariae]KAE9151719.1 hypothetical protein PF006_g3994 [Phytophthora fragariae]KAE9326819.1 hypothetical protein PF001_g2251 [Phytophthora fragariae]
MARRFELSETDLPTLNQVQWFIAAFTKAKLHRNDDYHGILGQIDALAYGPETNDTQPFSFAWQRTAQEKPDWCQEHLRKRGWGRLDEATARYLRRQSLVQRRTGSTVSEVFKRLLDAVPQARITKDRLIEAASKGDDAGEAEWVVDAEIDLSGRPIY